MADERKNVMWCLCGCGAPVWPENFSLPDPNGTPTPVYFVDAFHAQLWRLREAAQAVVAFHAPDRKPDREACSKPMVALRAELRAAWDDETFIPVEGHTWGDLIRARDLTDEGTL